MKTKKRREKIRRQMPFWNTSQNVLLKTWVCHSLKGDDKGILNDTG
jgi:hypothetical protein